MIKFFRHIRQSLLMENKTSKPARITQSGRYFKYAIGEIALVMIGILLALQVNNWNEGRKQKQAIESLTQVFESELEANILSSSSLIRHGFRVDSITTLYVNDRLSREHLLNERRLLRYLDFNTNTRRFIHDNLDELIASEKQLPSVYKQLIPELKQLKWRIESQRKWEQVAIDLSISRVKEMSDLYPWFNNWRDSLSQESFIDHLLTDPIYKSKLRNYHYYQLNENIWDASLIRTSSVAILWELKQIKGTAPSNIEEFLGQLDLSSIHKMDCSAYPFEVEEEINFRSNPIYYNNRKDTVYYNVRNSEGRILNRSERFFPPYSFQLASGSFGSNRCLEILENDSCQAVYRRSKEDYLIIN